MQAIEVGESFHVQHAYATLSDHHHLKGVINSFSRNETFTDL